MTIVDVIAAGDALTDSGIALDERYTAHNYSPLPVVVATTAEIDWAIDQFAETLTDALS